MCFQVAKWKREQVNDHKFDYVEVNAFVNPSCTNHLLYGIVFIVVLRMVVIYILELMNALLLLINDKWAVEDQAKDMDEILAWGKWIYVGSVVISYLLLAMDIRKARKIIKSRDISFAYTSPLAYDYYCLTSYAYFCFFQQISNMKGTWDKVGIYVFFAFKGWKRLFLAELPRHTINAYIIWEELFSDEAKLTEYLNSFSSFDSRTILNKMGVTVTLLVFAFWIVRFLNVVVASVVYVPLVCKIRGNLKEYSCHKIDKRIAEILKERSRRRIIKERQASFYRKQKGLPSISRDGTDRAQPTLPNVGPVTLNDKDLYDRDDWTYPNAAAPGKSQYAMGTMGSQSSSNTYTPYTKPYYGLGTPTTSTSTTATTTTTTTGGMKTSPGIVPYQMGTPQMTPQMGYSTAYQANYTPLSHAMVVQSPGGQHHSHQQQQQQHAPWYHQKSSSNPTTGGPQSQPSTPSTRAATSPTNSQYGPGYHSYNQFQQQQHHPQQQQQQQRRKR